MSGITTLGLEGARPVGGDPNFRLDVGSVVRRTFRVWAANFVPFSLVGLVAYAPVLLVIAFLGVTGSFTPLAERLVDLVANLFTLLLTGAVTYGVFRELHGHRAGAGEVLRIGLSRFGTVWATAIRVGLAALLGFCALVIPGIVLLMRYWVAVPVTVIESLDSSASLQRSEDLTEGNRWRVFAIATIMFVSMLAGMLVVGVLGTVIIAAADPASAAAESQSAPVTSPLVQGAMTFLAIPIQCLAAVAPAVAYHDLRVGKEGADVEELLRVFE